jgi:glycosyltransferase domain-containing protein
MIVGIVVPTKNQSRFVEQQLRYYASLNSPHTIYIGDSSNDEHKQKILAVIEDLKGKVNVVFRSYPDLNGELVQKELVYIVKEKYAVYAGDDDIFIPGSLTECATFLEKNGDYSSAHGGVNIALNVETNSGQHHIQSAWPYQLKKNILPLASERLASFLRQNYWVIQFAVRRTVEYQIAVADFDDLPDRSFTEIICGCTSIIQGKAKALNRLHMVRQIHPQRNLLLNSHEWIFHPNWQPSFMVFHDKLTKMLCEKEGMPFEESSEIIKKSMKCYLLKSLSREDESMKLNLKINFRLLLNKIPMLNSSYKYLKRYFPNSDKHINLEGLLNPRHIYYKDFIIIYKLITSKIF